MSFVKCVLVSLLVTGCAIQPEHKLVDSSRLVTKAAKVQRPPSLSEPSADGAHACQSTKNAPSCDGHNVGEFESKLESLMRKLEVANIDLTNTRKQLVEAIETISDLKARLTASAENANSLQLRLSEAEVRLKILLEHGAQDIKKLLISRSAEQYIQRAANPCPCPNTPLGSGNCGKRSAYCKSGSTLCYPDNIDPDMIERYKLGTPIAKLKPKSTRGDPRCS